MPQAPRKDVNVQKAQDKESKRARGALSCAECRRLKLKCDKTVPCSSCKRRGCSAICPNGSLITGQGTRFVLADTEKLHSKISQMSDRIRQLEDALAVSHSTAATTEPHPLLSRELLKIKSSLELHSAVDDDDKEPAERDDTEESQYIDAFGTLAIRDDGAATFYGRSAGSESLLIGEVPPPTPDPSSSIQPHFLNDPQSGGFAQPQQHYLPPEITKLASNFPLASSIYRPGTDLDHIIHSYLPSWEGAMRLCHLYLEQAPWFFGAVTKRQLDEEILPMWYKEAPRPMMPSSSGGMASNGASPTGSSMSNGHGGEPNGASSAAKGSAHDLALLFVIFCFGSLTDMEMPAAPDNAEAEQYYQLTKACLTIEPVLERPPSVATVQTLSLMAIYEGLCSKQHSIESTWALFGMATKLAQSIGLHRDCARWKLSPAEVQKRRALFWELFITDCWQSLATGRLTTFSLPFVDCELPSDPDQTMADDGTIQPSFPNWKARFGAECVSAVVQGTLTSRAPKYSIILNLDRKVRDMELPLYAQGPPPQGLGLAQTMSHFMPINYRELTLLYIHRCFFAHALSSNSLDPIKSAYAPSFLAGYRSACTIINSIKEQFTLFPAQIARFWVLWTHAFSASVMIASVVTHSPKCKVAPAALLELKTACDLFESAASYGGRAVKFLPILKRFQAKAQQVYRDVNSGAQLPRIGNDIFRPSQAEEKDELLIFSGKTHTVATKVNTNGSTPRSTGSSPQDSSANMAATSRSSSGSPGQSFADNPSFANVHPSLVNELNMFDGHIRAQIQNAYRAGGEVFGTAMVIDSLPPPQAVMMHPHQEALQHEQQHQHQQRFLQQMEHQREVERLEMERQSAARQHQLLQEQQHQQEELRRQQQMEQQRKDHYHRQQMEVQQQQRQMQEQHRPSQQHQHPMPHLQQHRSSREYEARVQYTQPVDAERGGYVPHASVAGPSHSLHRIPTRSLSNLHQVHQQQQQQQHHHVEHHPYHQPVTAASRHHHAHASQHQMYAVPHGEYGHHQSAAPAQLQQLQPSSSHYAQPPSTSGGYDTTSMATTPQHSVPQTPVSTQSVESYQHWPAVPTAYAGGPGQPQHYATQQPYHYTPDAALRGIAAEDPRLQETWQSYMRNVGSPRIFDD